jgi:hypothetical protein
VGGGGGDDGWIFLKTVDIKVLNNSTTAQSDDGYHCIKKLEKDLPGRNFNMTEGFWSTEGKLIQFVKENLTIRTVFYSKRTPINRKKTKSVRCDGILRIQRNAQASAKYGYRLDVSKTAQTISECQKCCATPQV